MSQTMHEVGNRHAPTAAVRGLLLQLLRPDLQAGARFLFHPNLECEEQWSVGAVKLPRVQRQHDARILATSEELALLVVGAPDAALLQRDSDPGFLAYLEELGFQIPRRVVAPAPFGQLEHSAVTASTTASIASAFGDTASEGRVHLLAHGNTSEQESLSAALAMPLVGTSAAIAASVNSKVFSRQLVKRLNLTSVPGRESNSLEELAVAFDELTSDSQGRTGRLVLKEALGVSGKGLMIIDSTATFETVMALLKRRAKKGHAVAFVLERWIDKLADINYQILVPHEGPIRLLGIKQCIVERGIHLGHRWPATLSDDQLRVYQEAAELIGMALRREGFVGIAGIDSLIADDGTVYPVLEINARFNMSTYELALESLVPPDRTTVVRMYQLTLSQSVAFEDLRRRLGGTLFGIDGRQEGAGILTFNGINCNVGPTGQDVRGRCWAWLVGRTPAELGAIEHRLLTAFGECGCGVLAAA